MLPAFLWQSTLPEQLASFEKLRPMLIEMLLSERGGRAAIVTLLLATLSVTVGQSLLLLANQVRPSRFLASLFFSGVTFVATLGLWIVTIDLIGRSYFDVRLGLRAIAILVIASFAPLVNGYLGILPYIGSCIIRLLYLQSASILFIVLWALGFGVRGALAVMGLGILIILIGRVTVLAPLYWLQNKVAGKTLQRRYQTIIAGIHLELDP
ncbi:MAG: hypothetical protein KDE53_06425 [Caldilineaceae bacterium]|nr:hypothetical protein [Caldilineaceae bacterium]MCB0127036.1 hypothetical protein [Caldilineaceae bacterium]